MDSQCGLKNTRTYFVKVVKIWQIRTPHYETLFTINRGGKIDGPPCVFWVTDTWSPTLAKMGDSDSIVGVKPGVDSILVSFQSELCNPDCVFNCDSSDDQLMCTPTGPNVRHAVKSFRHLFHYTILTLPTISVLYNMIILLIPFQQGRISASFPCIYLY